jgi:hypothetical protein
MAARDLVPFPLRPAMKRGAAHVSPTPYYQNTPKLGRLLAEWGKAPAGCLFLETGSHLTRRCRKADSNRWSHLRLNGSDAGSPANSDVSAAPHRQAIARTVGD